MKLEINLPSSCSDCVFCEESIYCGLLCGEPLYPKTEEDHDYEHRAKFCPFDSREKRDKMHEGVRIIEA